MDLNIDKWGGSSLTDMKEAINITGIQKDKIPNTYVPGRNTIFIAIGLSLAEATGSKNLCLGVNSIDYSGYPDCRPDYISKYQELANLSSKAGIEGKQINILTPLITMDKVNIIREAKRLNINIEETWSCYSGKEKPCNKCDSCLLRNKALNIINRVN